MKRLNLLQNPAPLKASDVLALICREYPGLLDGEIEVNGAELQELLTHLLERYVDRDRLTNK